MNIQKGQLQNLTLKNKVYHPFLGEGRIIEIKEDSLTINFKFITKKFETNGLIGETTFVTELYLQPIKIVAQAE